MRDEEEPGWEGAQAQGKGLVLGDPHLVRWWVKGHPQGQATGSSLVSGTLSHPLDSPRGLGAGPGLWEAMCVFPQLMGLLASAC